ncbi:hypothetical protein [Kingella sp. (in: b-proteobacteria)]|nr:hypothetical protein [Kingella sp. (in: b-proteobacteria)]MDO4657829.1 hypothetical protein [Kingella sp. (in: b-proteobacteria)]
MFICFQAAYWITAGAWRWYACSRGSLSLRQPENASNHFQSAFDSGA